MGKQGQIYIVGVVLEQYHMISSKKLKSIITAVQRLIFT